MVDGENPYSKMQRAQYDKDASDWSLSNKNPVIGNYDAHLAYDDFEELFGRDTTGVEWVLDFGCGPGRNLVRFGTKFRVIDGVDISPICLEKAKLNLDAEGFELKDFRLYETNGVDLQNIQSETYDIVMSVITLQHICVHDIRYNLMEEFFRVLQPSGKFTAQMGFGQRQGGQDYYANFYQAEGTNGWNDVMVTNPSQLEKDLLEIGFENFQYALRPVRGGDVHEQWIYFNATKP